MTISPNAVEGYLESLLIRELSSITYEYFVDEMFIVNSSVVLLHRNDDELMKFITRHYFRLPNDEDFTLDVIRIITHFIVCNEKYELLYALTNPIEGYSHHLDKEHQQKYNNIIDNNTFQHSDSKKVVLFLARNYSEQELIDKLYQPFYDNTRSALLYLLCQKYTPTPQEVLRQLQRRRETILDADYIYPFLSYLTKGIIEKLIQDSISKYGTTLYYEDYSVLKSWPDRESGGILLAAHHFGITLAKCKKGHIVLDNRKVVDGTASLESLCQQCISCAN